MRRVLLPSNLYLKCVSGGGLSFFLSLSFDDDGNARPGLQRAKQRISELASHTFRGEKISSSRTAYDDPLLCYILLVPHTRTTPSCKA